MKIGDIIDNGTKRVTKVFMLCGSEAYQTEPVGEGFKAFPMNPPVEEPVEEKKTVRRRKKA